MVGKNKDCSKKCLEEWLCKKLRGQQVTLEEGMLTSASRMEEQTLQFIKGTEKLVWVGPGKQDHGLVVLEMASMQGGFNGIGSTLQ